ncbi:MAG: putative deoxyribonuclease RhsA [Bacteroidetes bacterium ADurb.Bin408]|nr:MAG: putative deoxyribonuclease RhsA [Bacteroidetes bacterium ADurb.Bin408]
MRVEESCVQGESWNCFINPIIYHQGLLKIKPLRSHLVSITVPGGKVYRFEALPNPSQNIVSMESPFNITYTQLGGKGASLRPLDMTGNVLAYGEAPGNFTFVDSSSFAIYNPNLYELTTQDGTKYVISQSDGLISMEDLNGNKLTIDANGIHHTSGKDISFTRDAEGRITRITAPDGKYISYGYDANGDLVEFKDRVQTEDSSKGKVTYQYNSTHGLTSIGDPRDNANKPITNEYSEDGRLLKHIDANGKEIVYNYDFTAGKVSCTNRLLKNTEYEYNERGNVIKKTEYNFGVPYVTNYEYDEYDNKTKETLVNKPGIYTEYKYEDLNPGAGYAAITKDMQLVTEQIDPEGNHTYYKYDTNGRVLKTIDPRGFATENYYDAKGNLMWTKDAKGYYTYYNYDARGNMTYMKDAENNETTYAYTGDYMTSQTQGGVTTAYTYDAMGNMVTESRPEPNNETGTLTTIYLYDNNGRQVKTTNFDTTFTETAYDSLGKPVVRSDKKGRETETAYDEMGRVDYVLRPDGSKDVNHYDNEGRLTWVESFNKNFELKNTYHEYDDLGRKTRTNYHGGSYSTSVYDEQGRVFEERGRDGVITYYTYDNAGRRMSMTRGNYHVSYGYDANGNQVSSADANGTITNHYDELNRLTQTDYPENRYKYYKYDKTGVSS